MSLHRPGAVAAVAVLLSAAWAEAMAPSRVGRERVVFSTVAGDIVFAFYPDAAPETVRQFLTLVNAGVYDHLYFHHIDPGYVLQLTTHQNRTPPLTPSQLALIHPLKAEFSAVAHRRGTLSMAHRDNEPDSALTSFSILLGDAPHLDGSYTAFGFVERGMDVVEELCRVPLRPNKLPIVPLEVRKATVFDSADALERVPLAPASPLFIPQEYRDLPTSPPTDSSTRPEVGGGVLLMIALAVACWLSWNRLPSRVLASLVLMIVLVGAFLVLVLFLPLGWVGDRNTAVAVGLFVGLLALFRLMSRFEPPPS
jgi:cyclophilin family peptidyl-prolyl cis-trans isomerase